jgi:hypothetical protein
MTTLANLVSQVRDEIKIDPKGSINSTVLIERNLNRALRKIQEDTNYDLPDNAAYASLNLVAGTLEYDLPTDFMKMAEPQSVKLDSSTPIYPSDYNTLLASYDLSQGGGAPTKYYVRKESGAWKMGFYPLPGNSGVITAPYLKKLQEMDADNDSPLPSEYDELLVLYASYLTLRRIPGYEQQSEVDYRAYKELSKSLLANSLMYNRHSMRFGTQRRQRGINPNPRAISSNTFNVN